MLLAWRDVPPPVGTNVTIEPEEKPAPLMVIAVPPGVPPCVGVIEVTDGTTAL